MFVIPSLNFRLNCTTSLQYNNMQWFSICKYISVLFISIAKLPSIVRQHIHINELLMDWVHYESKRIPIWRSYISKKSSKTSLLNTYLQFVAMVDYHIIWISCVQTSDSISCFHRINTMHHTTSYIHMILTAELNRWYWYLLFSALDTYIITVYNKISRHSDTQRNIIQYKEQRKNSLPKSYICFLAAVAA